MLVSRFGPRSQFTLRFVLKWTPSSNRPIPEPLLEYSLVIAFTIGLASTLHCLGMCGGIIGALTFSLPAEARGSRGRLVPYTLAYNIGRIASYSLAGALAGALGNTLLNGSTGLRYGHVVIQLIATFILIGIGLYLAGWFPKFGLLEKIGEPWWHRIEPYGRRLIPVRSPLQAVLFGVVWGWLPCGLVYSTLIWTVSAGSALDGAALMLAFGAGTLPSTITAGILTGWMARLTRLPYVRQFVGLSIVAMALGTLWFTSGGFSPAG